jgi:very-short-patch-repair endonuclease
MAVRNVVIGQRIGRDKLAQARELRRRMTAEEKALWQRLRANRLGGLHFRRQQIVGGYIVDFYCHAAGLVVEVDGGAHQHQQQYDAEREMLLSARGLRVVRVTNEEVRRDIADVLRRIALACRVEPPFPGAGTEDPGPGFLPLPLQGRGPGG